MLHELESFRRGLTRAYAAADITCVIAVRLHRDNPWVEERLRKLAGYYEPAPRILVVDFGSDSERGSTIERICREHGFLHLVERDDGVFSLARARNLGVARAETDLVFFSDVDCFGPKTLFGKLAEQANLMDLGACVDQMLNLPVYHLDDTTSRAFLDEPDRDQASQGLARAMVVGGLSARGSVVDYVDPFSNFFLCHRRFFDFVGGYNENFRGHGSEDFEFLLRFAVSTGQFPLPSFPLENRYGSAHSDFFQAKAYRGHRRLGELMALQSETAGLRIAHLHHPRPKTSASWYSHNDWSKVRLREQAGKFLENPDRLLDFDWMPRKKKTLVLVEKRGQARFFLPLRLAGHRLEVGSLDDQQAVQRARIRVENSELGGLAAFGELVDSRGEVSSLFRGARQAGVETLVARRGVLPDSWFFSSEQDKGELDGPARTVARASFSEKQLTVAEGYRRLLREGGARSDRREAFQATRRRLESLRKGYDRVCLVSLDAPDADFERALERAVGQRPDVLFMIRGSTKTENRFGAKNVVWCEEDDDPVALVECADGVVCQNGEIGLLGLLLDRPVATTERAPYDFEGWGLHVAGVSAAIDRVGLGLRPARPFDPLHLVAWLLFSRYSFYHETLPTSEGSGRRGAPGAMSTELDVYHFNLGATRLSTLRARREMPFSESSYAAGRLGTRVQDIEVPREKGLLGRKLEKLRADPRKFLSDSRFFALRWAGRRLSPPKD